MSEAHAAADARDVAASTVRVNRTVPQVESPARTLAFSERPTPEELFRARVFEEPLVPVGCKPMETENAALAAALVGYSQRNGPDDFASITGFLEVHPQSPWRAALLTDLGLEYYSTAHYSLALEAWSKAWDLLKGAPSGPEKALADRALGELAYMYARIGRMAELEALLQSVEGRVFIGSATEKIAGAKAGLDNMKNRPAIAFRCGPLALGSIKLTTEPHTPGYEEVLKSASTQKGFSLAQVEELSKLMGLNYQMGFKEKAAGFVVPSVIHWKVGHYAAVVRQEGDRFLVKDPTFWSDVWATREALEAEGSGYYLVPPGRLATGWRSVDANEGETVWGKGNVCCHDPGPHGPCDPGSGGGNSCKTKKDDCKGMAVSSVHLMLVSLNLRDEPVGYSPPVGPAVRFKVRYNQRDAFQPANFTYSNFGPKWTCDFVSYIKDNPSSLAADVQYYIMGGGTRTFTGFDTNTQAFASQLYDQTHLTRTGPNSYEMLWRDGSKLIFAQPDGAVGTVRKVFLTGIQDPSGNTASLTYDANLRLVSIADAIGQVTTLSYGHPTDIYKVTQVTDPFGRFATFQYDDSRRLTNITDVIGLSSRFIYEGAGDFINALITPYGTNSYFTGESGTTRWLETLYPDGQRDRVEFNESVPMASSAAIVPTGMRTHSDYLQYRNTFYWSKIAYALGYPDYRKAKIYHWLHTADGASAAGILESEQEPLENRVWYDYAGQPDPIVVGTNNKPLHIGRVLDDGTTQLYTYEYNSFGNPTKIIDPAGRTTSYVFNTNGVDLVEVRQTRGGANELLFRTVFNERHLPITTTDVAGQATTYAYNSPGQIASITDPKGQVTAFDYDVNGYMISVDGPLSGAVDVVTATYDAFGRIRTRTDSDGYKVTLDYDNLDRVTKVTYPDSTSQVYGYTFLDLTLQQDRAGRQTLLEYDPVQQLARRTDPLGRVTRYQWCTCGAVKSVTDALGRTTVVRNDVQGRPISKEYADGSKVTFIYERTTSRLQQVIDEQSQITQYSYNPDDSLSAISYANTVIPTASVFFTYDSNYDRTVSMTDGIGTTRYTYVPVTVPAPLGAGQLASVDGPLPSEMLTFSYDELGRRVSTSINGVASSSSFDAAGRVVAETNALGPFSYSYEGASGRLLLQSFPNGQTVERAYGNNLQDRALLGMTHRFGNIPISEFLYDRDVAAGRITSWSQQSGSHTPGIYSLSYDPVNQLVLAALSQSGVPARNYSYNYDLAGNRVLEQIDTTTNLAAFNALNQLTSVAGLSGVAVTNEWDAEHRLAAVNSGNQRTELTYDGLGQCVGIRQLASGVEVSNRRLVWCDHAVCEERDPAGTVTKRFFPQGMKLETGAAAGAYYYTRDHLGSVRELVDSAGNVRGRYSYDPFGRRTLVEGDLETDFGFAGMFWAGEAGLSLTAFRAYDADTGRWLSRDPIENAEIEEGPNLYAYVQNDPVNQRDPLGLCCEAEEEDFKQALNAHRQSCDAAKKAYNEACAKAMKKNPKSARQTCAVEDAKWIGTCNGTWLAVERATDAWNACTRKPCQPPAKCKLGPPPPAPPPPGPKPHCLWRFCIVW
jgi:RHS repeat-associated protein